MMRSAAILALVTLLAFSAEARLLARKGKRAGTPVTEKVTVGGYGAATDTGSDIVFNECFDFTENVKPVAKVCGTSTKVVMYLRGRCESYSKYQEDVGTCDKTKASDSCVEVDGTTEDAGWLKEAQSYMAVPC